MLLFLDFDGVMHPSFCVEQNFFCRGALFADAMREHPGASIVISSSWRHFHSLEELCAFFPADIAARIIGTTKQSDSRPRHEEILDYLGDCSGLHISWVALDDSRFEFPARCPNLILCDGRVGLTEVDVTRLHNLIHGLTGGQGEACDR
jgi:hypothetical protein